MMLFNFRLCKPHLDCLGTTAAPLSNLKLHLLSFSNGIIFYALKLAAMEEKVFTLRSLDEAKSSVCD